MLQDLTENQSKEADMPQIAVQDTEEQVEAEAGDVEATEEETTDLKVLEKKKVTMIIMIKKNQRLMKDQEDHTDAEEGVDAVVVTVVEEDIADVPEVMVQEMKILRMKAVVLKTKAVNQKDVEMKAVIDAGPEDSADDQDDHLHRALETKVIIGIEENKVIVATEESKKNGVREDLKDVEIVVVVAEDVDAPRDRIVHVSHEMRVEKKHPRVAHLRNKNLKTKPHHSLLRFKTRLREETYSTSKLLLRYEQSHLKILSSSRSDFQLYDKRSSI